MKRRLLNYLLHRSGVFPRCPEYYLSNFRAAAGHLFILYIVLFCHVLTHYQKTLLKYLSQLLDKYRKQTSTLISETLISLITKTCVVLNYRIAITATSIKTILESRRIKSEFFSKECLDHCLPKNVHPV